MKKINPEGLRLIQEFEGCSLVSYQDQRGIWTVGYGSTTAVGPGLSITSEECLARLEQDLESKEMILNHLIEYPVNENQFSACVCLAYNIGCGSFARSTLLKELNAGNLEAAADQFLVWNKINGQVSQGLSRRRLAEKALFLKPVSL